MSGLTSLPWVCAVPVAIFAVYGVAVNHDLYSGARARLVAVDEVQAAAVPRSAMRAGFEYDGWTEIELSGYINDPRIRVPVDAVKPWALPHAYPGCVDWMYGYTPSIHAKYVFSNEDKVCYATAPFAPVTYKAWLPPFNRTIFILSSSSLLPAALLPDTSTNPIARGLMRKH